MSSLVVTMAAKIIIFTPVQIRDAVQKLVKIEYKKFIALVYNTQALHEVTNYQVMVSAAKCTYNLPVKLGGTLSLS